MWLHRYGCVFTAWILLSCGFLSITFTYDKLTQVIDEPAHIATGIQWWSEHHYTLEPLHPPLARIAESALLYLKGVVYNEYTPAQTIYHMGSAMLLYADEYEKNLSLARYGVLPFYLLGGLVVFAWSRHLFGSGAALLSLALYVLTPVIAGHAGLATTDMPYAALFIAAVYVFTRWLETPSLAWSILLAISTAGMLLTKFSALVHFPAAVALIVLFRWKWPTVAAAKHALLIVVPVCALLVDALYFFDHFQAFRQGIEQIINKNSQGHALWLWKPLNKQAVWYFFPVGIFFKSPLPLLAFFTAGVWWAMRHERRDAIFPVLAAAGVLVPSMFSNINIGVRHVLPFFPLMAVTAGYGAYRMLSLARPRAVAALATLLIAWQGISFVQAAPHYFSYFNMLAGSEPEKILVDSDKEWGQDYFYLEKALKAHGIEEISVCTLGTWTSPLKKILSARVLPCRWKYNAYAGWLVVGDSIRMLDPNPEAENFPYEPIGQSLRLYYIPVK